MLARLIALAAVLMAGAVAMTACTARAGVSGWSPSLQASFASLVARKRTRRATIPSTSRKIDRPHRDAVRWNLRRG